MIYLHRTLTKLTGVALLQLYMAVQYDMRACDFFKSEIAVCDMTCIPVCRTYPFYSRNYINAGLDTRYIIDNL